MIASANDTSAPLVLASGSPRRRDLLAAVGLEFEVIPPDVDESVRAGEAGAEAAVRLALAKAREVAARRPGAPVLAADTLVVAGPRILGKPADDRDASRMLRALSGRWHEVVTGLALIAPGRDPATGHATTRVRFAELEPGEIERYVRGGEPRGKAGAYAIQGAGGWLVEEIRGSPSNVIGLPLELLRRLAGDAGIRPRLAATGGAEPQSDS